MVLSVQMRKRLHGHLKQIYKNNWIVQHIWLILRKYMALLFICFNQKGFTRDLSRNVTNNVLFYAITKNIFLPKPIVIPLIKPCSIVTLISRHFENNIVEKSVHTPALVLFYTDWCFDCVRSAAAWRRLVDALQPLGVTMATVHAGHEASLARRVGIHGVPCLTLVLDKHVYSYKESLQSMPKILGMFTLLNCRGRPKIFFHMDFERKTHMMIMGGSS